MPNDTAPNPYKAEMNPKRQSQENAPAHPAMRLGLLCVHVGALRVRGGHTQLLSGERESLGLGLGFGVFMVL